MSGLPIQSESQEVSHDQEVGFCMLPSNNLRQPGFLTNQCARQRVMTFLPACWLARKLASLTTLWSSLSSWPMAHGTSWPGTLDQSGNWEVGYGQEACITLPCITYQWGHGPVSWLSDWLGSWLNTANRHCGSTWLPDQSGCQAAINYPPPNWCRCIPVPFQVLNIFFILLKYISGP